MTEHKDKFIVTEWAREQWGLWMLFGDEYRCILPLKDAKRGDLVNLASELNAVWKADGIKSKQRYYVQDARIPNAAGIGRRFLYGVNSYPDKETIDVFRTRGQAERIRDALNVALYAGEWIEAEDSLPDEGIDVLISRIYQGHRRAFIARLFSSKVRGGQWVMHPNTMVIGTVTHWMPLPDLPTTICGHPVKVSEDILEDTIVVTDGKYEVKITNIGGE